MKRLTVLFLLFGLMACSQSPEPDPTSQDGGGMADADAGDDAVQEDADASEPDTLPDLPMEDIREIDVQPDGMDEPDAAPDVDSGPSCNPDLDTDADGLNNCDEQELCTDPTDGDTDDDQLSDLEELTLGTDPCNADTDNDGASDSTEVDVSLNPNNPSTFSDGILDGNRWRVNACAPPEDPDEDFTGTIGYYTSDVGNYKIGLPPGFSNYRQIELRNTQPPVAAGTYGDSLTSVYGFIVSKDAEDGRTSPDASLRDEVRPEILDLAGNDPNNLIFGNNGGAFETHGGKTAAIGRYQIKSPSPKSAAKVRQELMLSLEAFNGGNVAGSGLPSTAGQQYTEFRIFVSVIFRSNTSGPSQALVSAAVAPAEVYDTRNQVRFQMDDLTNTTSIAEAVDEAKVGCERYIPSSEPPKAYFYWVLDQSGSMDGNNSDLAAFASNFTAQLQGTQLEYYLGVTNMDVDNGGRLYNPWTQNPSQFSSDIQQGVIGCSTGGPWACNSGTEKGLESGMQGIRFMRGRSTPSPPAAEAIASNASLITVFFSDEPDRSVNPSFGGGAVPEQKYLDFYGGPAQTTAFALTGTEDCEPIYGPGTSYQNVAFQTGGTFASICSDLTQILGDIIDAAVANATEYQLSETPVSASLSVFTESDEDPTTSTFVPRSESDGFQYFAQDNAVGFFGSYRPEIREGDYAKDFVAVRYEYFIDRCKDTGGGADNCREDIE